MFLRKISAMSLMGFGLRGDDLVFFVRCIAPFWRGKSRVGELSAVEQAGALAAGDGSDGDAVNGAGDELADALGVRLAGQSGSVCDLSGARQVLFAQVSFAYLVGCGEIRTAADLDGDVGYGVYAGEPAHSSLCSFYS